MADELLPNIARLSEVLQKDPGSRLFYPLAEEYVKNNMLEEAVQVLTEGLKRHPEMLSARVTLGKVHFEQGNLNDARKEFEEVLTAHPDNLMALKKLSVIYRRQGATDQAKRCAEALLAANPKDAEAAQLLQEFNAAAAKKAGGAIDLSPLDPPASPSAAAPPSGVRVVTIEDEAEEAPPAPPGKLPAALAPSHEPAAPAISPSAPPAVASETSPPAAPATRTPQTTDDDAPEEELVSPTLAQLYLRQGHYEQAVRVYDELLRREPQNDTYRQAHSIALALLQGQSSPASSVSSGAPAGEPSTSVLPAISAHEPAIRRLQGWLEQIRRQRRRRA
jgi:tetratricopeptide (TPR) repeat protein